MPFKKIFSTIFQIFVLVVTTWLVAATSTSELQSTPNIYYISSDCVTPAEKDIQVTIQDGLVTEPPGTVMGDFGFPQDDILVPGTTALIFPEEVEGTVGSVTRRCRKTYVPWDGDVETRVYSCSDDDVYSCSIVFGDPNL